MQKWATSACHPVTSSRPIQPVSQRDKGSKVLERGARAHSAGEHIGDRAVRGAVVSGWLIIAYDISWL